MAEGAKATGRGGEVAFVADGLMKFLRQASQASPDFNKEMRNAALDVADQIVKKAKVSAAGQPPHGRNPGSRSQAAAVVDGLRARHDRVPLIKLDHKRGFVSRSRSNRKRKTKVTMGDVFFGAEFGGGRRKTTRQFLRHRGRSGYFFWHTVRENRDFIIREYFDAIERVLKKLGIGAS